MSTEFDPRLRVLSHFVNSTVPPRIDYFPPGAWDQAIDWARTMSLAEAINWVQVVNALSMELARFTGTKLYRPQETPK